MNYGLQVLDSAFEQLDIKAGNSDSEEDDANERMELILEPKVKTFNCNIYCYTCCDMGPLLGCRIVKMWPSRLRSEDVTWCSHIDSHQSEGCSTGASIQHLLGPSMPSWGSTKMQASFLLSRCLLQPYQMVRERRQLQKSPS